MKIYTKTGDKGFTSLTGGRRIKKNDPLVEAYGTIDEANSIIGLALSKIKEDDLGKLKKMLLEIQRDLFHVGSELSTPQGEKVYWPLDGSQLKSLEVYIDELELELPELKSFILPGGSEIGAYLHVGRSIIRRAERNATSINNELVMAYLNRCSDFLFVAARWANFKMNRIENQFIPKEV